MARAYAAASPHAGRASLRLTGLYDRGMGKLLRRTAEGDEVLAEWSADDPGSVAEAERLYRDLIGQDYEAVSSDGTYFSPVDGDAFPADAAEVVLTTGMGGG